MVQGVELTMGVREREVPRMTQASPPALWGLDCPASLNQRLHESI